MRKLLAILLLLCPALAFAGGGFLAGLEDVPLPPQLTEAAGKGMVFDSPEGRIVEAEASGPMTRDQVLQFYAETLPQLGWVRVGDTRYRSETEILTFSFTPAAKTLIVHFNLTPSNH